MKTSGQFPHSKELGDAWLADEVFASLPTVLLAIVFEYARWISGEFVRIVHLKWSKKLVRRPTHFFSFNDSLYVVDGDQRIYSMCLGEGTQNDQSLSSLSPVWMHHRTSQIISPNLQVIENKICILDTKHDTLTLICIDLQNETTTEFPLPRRPAQDRFSNNFVYMSSKRTLYRFEYGPRQLVSFNIDTKLHLHEKTWPNSMHLEAMVQSFSAPKVLILALHIPYASAELLLNLNRRCARKMACIEDDAEHYTTLPWSLIQWFDTDTRTVISQCLVQGTITRLWPAHDETLYVWDNRIDKDDDDCSGIIAIDEHKLQHRIFSTKHHGMLSRVQWENTLVSVSPNGDIYVYRKEKDHVRQYHGLESISLRTSLI